jgi:hypothetical protein
MGEPSLAWGAVKEIGDLLHPAGKFELYRVARGRLAHGRPVGQTTDVKRNHIWRRARADTIVKDESLGLDPFPLLVDRKPCLHYIGDEALSYTFFSVENIPAEK